ncbi:MAG: hypothetical protein ACP5QT_08785 [Brevinematia bacterium]
MRLRFFFLFFIIFWKATYAKVMHFNWKPSGEGYLYRVQIASDSNFGRLFIDENTSNTFYIVDIPPGRYFFRIIPLWKGFEGEPSSFVSFEIAGTYDPNRETLKDIYPPEVLDRTIPARDEVLKLKPVFKTKKGHLKYNVNDLKNFRESDEVKIYTQNLDNGEHTVYFKTFNNTGMESKIKEYNFKIDRKSPELTISARTIKIGQREYLFFDSYIDFEVSDDDPDVKYYVWINGKRVEKERFYVSRDIDFIRCTIFAADSAGNVSSITKNFYVDTKPPQIHVNFTNISGRQIINGDFLEISYTDETSPLESKIFINDREYYINRIALRDLGTGEYKLKILVIDMFFNTNEKIYNLSITNEEKGIKGYLYE